MPQPSVQQSYEFAPPRPYAWKTDEFQTQAGTRAAQTGADSNRQLQGLQYQPSYSAMQPFRCPACGSTYLPRVEQRISTAGWITFAVLLVVFFPLFWIGLLIKEPVQVCQVCATRTPYRK